MLTHAILTKRMRLTDQDLNNELLPDEVLSSIVMPAIAALSVEAVVTLSKVSSLFYAAGIESASNASARKLERAVKNTDYDTVTKIVIKSPEYLFERIQRSVSFFKHEVSRPLYWALKNNDIFILDFCFNVIRNRHPDLLLAFIDQVLSHTEFLDLSDLKTAYEHFAKINLLFAEKKATLDQFQEAWLALGCAHKNLPLCLLTDFCNDPKNTKEQATIKVFDMKKNKLVTTLDEILPKLGKECALMFTWSPCGGRKRKHPTTAKIVTVAEMAAMGVEVKEDFERFVELNAKRTIKLAAMKVEWERLMSQLTLRQ